MKGSKGEVVVEVGENKLLMVPVSSKTVSGFGRKDCDGLMRRLSLKRLQVVATAE
jgi:hypothetical protein